MCPIDRKNRHKKDTNACHPKKRAGDSRHRRHAPKKSQGQAYNAKTQREKSGGHYIAVRPDGVLAHGFNYRIVVGAKTM